MYRFNSVVYVLPYKGFNAKKRVSASADTRFD